MASNGALAAQLTVPTGGWSVELTATGLGGPTTVTVPAGSYFPSELLTEFRNQLLAAFGSTFTGATVTASVGESGTGFVTVACSARTFTIAWTSTDLRDALGFAADLTPLALTFTGTLHQRGVWLPGAVMAATYGPNDPGHTKSDRSMSMSPRGDIWAVKYNSRVVLPSAGWSHVAKAKARVASETTTGASFERWWRYTHNAELSYFSVAPQVRLIWDADTPGTYDTYRLSEGDSTEMPKVVEDWNGLYRIELRNLIKVPS